MAAHNIVIDDGLDLVGFAQRAPELMGGELSFTVLPNPADAEDNRGTANGGGVPASRLTTNGSRACR